MKRNLNKPRTMASLKRELEKHELWLKSNGKQGKIFSAIDEDLRELNLSKANLIKADFMVLTLVVLTLVKLALVKPT